MDKQPVCPKQEDCQFYQKSYGDFCDSPPCPGLKKIESGYTCDITISQHHNQILNPSQAA